MRFLQGRPSSARFPERGLAGSGAGVPFPERLKKPTHSQALTERDRLVDLEAAKDPVHVASVSKAISSHDYLK